ncbi:MAG: hypothetical protein JW727_03200 [Candidatus Aenigmarchaeota archaeon]|nr:hypothetical protein [Candidatus Aenigmarchaeota archaeon]
MRSFLVQGILAGISMFAVMMAFGFISSAAFPELALEYQNEAIFRPLSDPAMYYMYLHPLLMGFLLAFVWNYGRGFIKGKSTLKKGAKFGLAIWAIFGIPGMLMTLSTFNVSSALVLSWTVSVLAQYLAGGIVLSRLDKQKI